MNTTRLGRGIAAIALCAMAVSATSATSARELSADDTNAVTTVSPAEEMQRMQDAADNSIDEFIVVLNDEARLGQDTRRVQEQTADFSRSLREELAGYEVVRPMAGGAVLVRAAQRHDRSGQSRAMQELSTLPGVESVSPNRMMFSYAFPTDPRVAEQHTLENPFGGMNMRQAYDIADGSGTIVGVIDTGIVRHPDLDANVVPGYDMISTADWARDGDGRDANPQDEGTYNGPMDCGGGLARDSSWHGSHVAGSIAAVANNGQGIAGIAPKAKIQPVRALGKCGGGSTADVADALMWAVGGEVPGVPTNQYKVDAVNLSLGSKAACEAVFKRGIDFATSRNIAVVVAAGNSSEEASLHSPSNCPGAISVGSTDKHGNQAHYSNFGPGLAISAPGGEASYIKTDGILSTVDGGKAGPTGSPTYNHLGGTSMASPHVAGMIALLRSVDKNMSVAKALDIMKSTARQAPGDCSKGCGAGIVDASAALRKVTGKGDTHVGREAIVNGSFNGTQGWSESRAGMISGGQAKINGMKYPRTDTLTQRVTIPNDGRVASLQFQIWVQSEEKLETKYNDTLKVTLGGETILDAGDLDGGNRFVQARFDVSKFIGRTVDLTFSGKEDSFRMTGYLIKDVSLKVGNGGGHGTPNPNPDPTPQPTPTPNPTPNPTPGPDPVPNPQPFQCDPLDGNMSGSVNAGGEAFMPNGRYYSTSNAGKHEFCVTGGAGTDFDLILQRYQNSWIDVASSNAPGTADKIAYDAQPGYYRLVVKSRNNSSGQFTLTYRTPS